jgi:hypothetical protein
MMKSRNCLKKQRPNIRRHQERKRNIFVERSSSVNGTRNGKLRQAPHQMRVLIQMMSLLQVILIEDANAAEVKEVEAIERMVVTAAQKTAAAPVLQIHLLRRHHHRRHLHHHRVVERAQKGGEGRIQKKQKKRHARKGRREIERKKSVVMILPIVTWRTTIKARFPNQVLKGKGVADYQAVDI